MSKRPNKSVSRSPDLDRVCALPRRTWPEGAAAQLAETWTPSLLTPKGLQVWEQLGRLGPSTREAEIVRFSREVCPIRISPEQTMILYEFLQLGGVAALAPVGAGKTLLMWLLALLSEEHFGTQRPALFAPAYLRDDTLKAHSLYSEYWRGARNGIQFVSYNELGLEKNAFLLCDCRKCRNGAEIEPGPQPIYPDLCLLDESDMTKNVGAAVSKRMGRYQKHHIHEVRTACASGSLFDTTFEDLFRPLTWCLKENAPVPFDYSTKIDWCAAMDPKPSRGQTAGNRTDPGALMHAFGADTTDPDRNRAARIAYGDRLAETPGFIIIDKASCTTEVHIRVLAAHDDPIIEEHFIPFRQYGKAEDGWILGDPLSKAAYGTALGCGYYDTWDPRPPAEWLFARNAYNQLVADTIATSQRRGQPIDTEKQARKWIKDHPATIAWRAIEKDFIPNPVPVTVSLSVLNYAVEWLKLNAPAIVWVDGSWLGEKLSELSGVPYFSSKGRASDGSTPQPGKSIIASVQSNYRGRNWWRWNRNLVLTPPSKNNWQEQIIGRTHRQGQQLDVYVDYLATSAESLRAFRNMQLTATGSQEALKLIPKILKATWDWSRVPDRVLNPSIDNEGHFARWYLKESIEL